jgi:hypothetical protein
MRLPIISYWLSIADRGKSGIAEAIQQPRAGTFFGLLIDEMSF